MMKFTVLLGVVLVCCFQIGHSNQNAVIEAGGKTFLGIVGSFNRPLPGDDVVTLGTIVFPNESNKLGCSEWSIEDSTKLEFVSKQGKTAFAALYRGECTFVVKTLNAQKAGASMVLVIDENNNVVPMGSDDTALKEFGIESTNDVIPSIMIGKELFGDPNNDNSEMNIRVKAYNKMIFDVAMIVMIIVATFLVGLGAYYSSDIERSRFYNGSVRSFRYQTETQEIDSSMAWSFVIVASIGLLTLFYFIKYIFYFILLVFVIGATNGLTSIGSHIVEMFQPSFDNIVFSKYDLSLTKSEIIAMVPSIGISLIWFLYRNEENAWILQDLMCVGLLMVLQRTVRMSNLQIATILLNMAFLYDIFWVFLSPYFFTKSVMVEVATYSHTSSRDTLPVVLKFPRLNDPFHSPMILGLGDIALPGLLVSYLLRFDYQSKIQRWRDGYFIMALIGYCVGMTLTDINLIIMEHGQPALLFLVPCTLWLVSWRAWKKGEFWRLWNGKPKVSTNGSGSSSSKTADNKCSDSD